MPRCVLLLAGAAFVLGVTSARAADPNDFASRTGDAVLQTDESGRWAVVAIDTADSKGQVDGRVDHLFFFHMAAATAPLVSKSFRRARVDHAAGELVLVSPDERVGFDFVMQGKKSTHEPLGVPTTTFANGTQLNHRSGEAVTAIDLRAFDVLRVDLPEDRADWMRKTEDEGPLYPDYGNGTGGGGCPGGCAATCAHGTCSAFCSPPRCARCDCVSGGLPSCGCS